MAQTFTFENRGSGQTGPAGASAYQVAVANGFVGTEAQWLASLQGSPGSPGDPGPSLITTDTETTIVGVHVGDSVTGTMRAANPGEIVSEAELNAAIETERFRISGPPTQILAGETYIVPERRQVLFTLPIVIDAGGVLQINGNLIQV